MANCYSTADFLGDGVISVESISDTAVVPAHSHEFIEMIYLSEGRTLHTCKGKAERMEKGDYVFVDYGAVHGFTEKSADFHAVSCLFVPEFIDISLRNSRSVSDILKNHISQARRVRVTLWVLQAPIYILLAAFVFHWPLPVVFLCTRIDQCFKWIIAFFRLRGDRWIRNVTRETAIDKN